MTILHASGGYDMTINVYYKIIKDGEKTVLCQEIGRKITDDTGMGGGRSIPDDSIIKGQPFRAFKRNYSWCDRTIYKSKYFFGDSADEWDGKANYYNTWD